MADECFTLVPVECGHCKTKQVVKMALNPGIRLGLGAKMVPCIRCKKNFDAMVPDTIIGGPYAV